MKLNRFFALAAIALLVVGAMGVLSARSFAQTTGSPAQAPATEAPETVSHPDAGNVEQQVGDRHAPDSGAALKASGTETVTERVGDQTTPDGGAALTASGTDTVTEQVGDQTTPDLGTQVGEATDGQETAPVGTPAITADQAKAAAEASLNAGAATAVTLDDENGKLVYSVEIGQTDVKVDALTGKVLGADPGGD